ncbi:hypothetical protein [Streptomyces sp. NPDC006875]|uniref:hypothetical protein n=1 Tax=Streptomyces sp. NPDC006875 TaxID=3154781 RepID=UPI0033E2A53C
MSAQAQFANVAAGTVAAAMVCYGKGEKGRAVQAAWQEVSVTRAAAAGLLRQQSGQPQEV